MKALREVVQRGSREDEVHPFVATFLRGLSLGALVGAAVAGSALLRRVRDARDPGGKDPGPPEPR